MASLPLTQTDDERPAVGWSRLHRPHERADDLAGHLRSEPVRVHALEGQELMSLLLAIGVGRPDLDAGLWE